MIDMGYFCDTCKKARLFAKCCKCLGECKKTPKHPSRPGAFTQLERGLFRRAKAKARSMRNSGNPYFLQADYEQSVLIIRDLIKARQFTAPIFAHGGKP